MSMNPDIERINYNLTESEVDECRDSLRDVAKVVLRLMKSNDAEILMSDGTYIKISRFSDEDMCFVSFEPTPGLLSYKHLIDSVEDREMPFKIWEGNGSIINLENNFISYSISGSASLKRNQNSGELNLSIISDGNDEITFVDRMRVLSNAILTQYGIE